MTITRFRGRYRFLSNFSYCDLVMNNGMKFKTAEHAYQSFKTKDPSEFQQIKEADTPGQAKRLGRHVNLKDNWEDIRVSVMRDVIAAKFEEGSSLADYLLDTGDEELIEGNNWGDKFWGQVDGIGLNFLGKLLMERRVMLKEMR